MFKDQFKDQLFDSSNVVDADPVSAENTPLSKPCGMTQNKISQISRFFACTFKLLMFIYPIFIIAYWLNIISVPRGYFAVSRYLVDVDINTLSINLRLIACFIDMIETSVVLMSFNYLTKLFNLYSENIIFSYQNVHYIRKLGYTLLWQVVASLLAQPLLSVVLTFNAPPGQHMISLGIGNQEISTLLIGGIVILISWIMEEGRKLEEEKSLTV